MERFYLTTWKGNVLLGIDRLYNVQVVAKHYFA